MLRKQVSHVSRFPVRGDCKQLTSDCTSSTFSASVTATSVPTLPAFIASVRELCYISTLIIPTLNQMYFPDFLFFKKCSHYIFFGLSRTIVSSFPFLPSYFCFKMLTAFNLIGDYGWFCDFSFYFSIFIFIYNKHLLFISLTFIWRKFPIYRKVKNSMVNLYHPPSVIISSLPVILDLWFHLYCP